VYWWGVLPFHQRRKIMERYSKRKTDQRVGRIIILMNHFQAFHLTTKDIHLTRMDDLGSSSRKSRSSSNYRSSGTNSGGNGVDVGCQVVMRKAPIHLAGSIAFTVAGNTSFLKRNKQKQRKYILFPTNRWSAKSRPTSK